MQSPYATKEDGLVGFGSIGISKHGWRIGGKKSPLEPLHVIPWVAVHRPFWGQPKQEESFSRRIMRDLIAEAISDPGGYRHIGLMVDPKNTPAIRLYNEFGFYALDKPYKDKEAGIDYTRMLLLLADYEAQREDWADFRI